ncbi:DUF5325 family protein [Brevibacillus ginsengisoli]|uniref:DUF5325 family protein n=1 Tax=Brevibacillus ginsengisoli TaxID=363854 RepID=UPI003CFAF383
MSTYKIVTLLIAISVASSLAGIGVAIGENSWFGGIACGLIAVCMMGFGFSYKKRHHS